jgi:hypothetical protein
MVKKDSEVKTPRAVKDQSWLDEKSFARYSGRRKGPTGY